MEIWYFQVSQDALTSFISRTKRCFSSYISERRWNLSPFLSTVGVCMRHKTARFLPEATSLQRLRREQINYDGRVALKRLRFLLWWFGWLASAQTVGKSSRCLQWHWHVAVPASGPRLYNINTKENTLHKTMTKKILCLATKQQL